MFRHSRWFGWIFVLGGLSLVPCVIQGAEEPAEVDTAAETTETVQDEEALVPLAEDSLGAPMRVRDYTFPSYLVLSFAPQPAAPLGKGKWALETHYSVVNNFQVSPAVEEYLEVTRGDTRRSLDAADAEFILGLPNDTGYYIDGEFRFAELILHYGVTERLDIGIGFYAIDFTGGDLDGTIFDFHESYDFGQQGRNFVVDDQFQIVIGGGDDSLVNLDGPPSGGVSDPSLYFRYALGQKGHWRFSLAGGVKIPLADEGFLSSGSTDFGFSLTADGRWRRNALLFNLSWVEAGRFDGANLEPPSLPSLQISWLHGFGKKRKLRFFLQGLAAEHVLRDTFDSGIADLELQLTTGLKRATPWGVFGIGLTENILSHDNTPDIGLHFSWGYLSK